MINYIFDFQIIEVLMYSTFVTQIFYINNCRVDILPKKLGQIIHKCTR